MRAAGILHEERSLGAEDPNSPLFNAEVAKSHVAMHGAAVYARRRPKMMRQRKYIDPNAHRPL